MKQTKFLAMLFMAFAVAFSACTNVDDPDDPKDEDPVVTVGDGTKAKPFSVAEVITINPQSTSEASNTGVWIKGFIVGYYNSTPNPAIVEAVAPFTDDVNIMVAAKAGETDKTKMVSVQLPAGAVRTALGLKTTPTNIAKEVLLYGDIMKYNTYPGLKNTAAYWYVEANTGIEPPTAGEFNVPVMTISELRTQWTGAMKTITDKKKIVGVVITDLVGGNSGSLRNLTIASEDNSAGIMVRLIENNTYSLGDKIEIAVEGLELNQFGMAVQLNNVPVVKTRRISTGATVTPKVTTIKDVRDNFASYESRLVTVTGTLTSGGGNTWYSGTGSGQNNKIASGTDELVLYVTKFAAFKAEVVPTGQKSVTGIVSQFSNATSTTYQLIIRNMADVK